MNENPWDKFPMLFSQIEKSLDSLDATMKSLELPTDKDEADLALWKSFVAMEDARQAYELAQENFEAQRLNVANIHIRILQEKITAKKSVEAPEPNKDAEPSIEQASVKNEAE